ncbi:Y-family DNA polymerase [Vibrio parahaemolyticus]|nr:Y-family DNA polymerase [Vibrio parahaemolyticus]
MFALIDANSYYAAAEAVFDLSIRGKSIIVLSNNDGCCVALNRQAKELGITRFAPYFKIKDICDRHDVVVRSSNYELYGDLSNKMMQVIGQFAQRQHVYSIDESFLDVSDCTKIYPDLYEHGHKLRRTVWKQTRLPVCVGYGPTLTLSKVANHAAKKVPGFNGVAVLRNQREWEPVLAQMETSDVWGVGSRISKRLADMRIHTALQLSKMDPKRARRMFNIELERTVRELQGEPAKEWDAVRADKQQIFSTRSNGERITDQDSLHQALAMHASTVASKARKQGSLACHLIAFAASSPFDENPVSFRYSHQLVVPTNDTRLIVAAATQGLPKLFRPGVRYYRVGVGLVELAPAKHAQYSLFDTDKSNPDLMKCIDMINARYGSGTLSIAAQGHNQKWAMRREFLSKQFTTKWSDIPKIHCK